MGHGKTACCCRIRRLNDCNLQPLIENGTDTPEFCERERGIFTGEFEDQLHPDLICGRY
jgi:hypothetical protein